MPWSLCRVFAFTVLNYPRFLISASGLVLNRSCSLDVHFSLLIRFFPGGHMVRCPGKLHFVISGVQ